MTVEREVLLTLTDNEHAELARNLRRLRRELQSTSNTTTILEAVRRQVQATVAEAKDRRSI